MRSFIYLVFCLFAGIGLTFSQVQAVDASPSCYRQLQTDFFGEQQVAQALSLYKVQQTAWRLIFNDLRKAAQGVPALVQARANAKVPNPLAPPFDAGGAIQILQESLFQVFYSTMMRYSSDPHNRINQNTINGAFRYLWDSQQNRIQQCQLLR
jgi:hypothetical protein